MTNGGAVSASYCNSNENGAAVSSSTLSNNSAVDGGAVGLGTGNCPSSVMVFTSTLDGNVASQRGGAIDSGQFATGFVWVNSTVANNAAR